jgi:hypothetical protein
MFVEDYWRERYPADLLWSLDELIPIFFEPPSVALWVKLSSMFIISTISHATDFLSTIGRIKKNLTINVN